MIGRDLHNTLDYRRAVSPVTQTNSDAPFVSQIIDVANLLALEFIILLGTLSDAAFTTAVLMEASDDPSMAGANAVADVDMLPTPNNVSSTVPEVAAAFTEADDDGIKRIGYVGTKRFVRLTITPTGNAAGNIPIAVLAVGLPRARA